MHRVSELQDPTYQYRVDIKNFQVSPLMKVSVLCVDLWPAAQSSCFLGHEGILPGYSGILHPLLDFPGGPSLLRAQKHALLRYIKVTKVPVLGARQTVTCMCCLIVPRSPAQVFDSADICGPGYKVCFRAVP